jgi:hypothetical protein
LPSAVRDYWAVTVGDVVRQADHDFSQGFAFASEQADAISEGFGG